MSTGYPSSWPHPTTQVIGDTIHTRTHTTAKPGHALARPGHCLVEEKSDVEAELHHIS